LELRFAGERTREAASCLGLLVLLKTFQCLGYFVKIADVPNSITRCIAKAAGYEEIPDLTGYDHKTARIDHLDLVRSWVGVSAFDHEARHMMVKACVDISRVREDLADIVNFEMEELIRQKGSVAKLAGGIWYRGGACRSRPPIPSKAAIFPVR